jgi:GNAT superfamily N-acetyltransferase
VPKTVEIGTLTIGDLLPVHSIKARHMPRARGEDAGVVYRVNPTVTNESLNELFGAAWPEHSCRDFRPILERSLAYICAYDANHHLVGFVNVAWDGGIHAFLLDTTVHPDWRRRGIGRNLIGHAEQFARESGMEWLHVDFDPHLRDFYLGCGFRATEAGLIGFNIGHLT